MNIPLITVPRHEAMAKIRTYRRLLEHRADEAAKDALAAYEKLGVGYALFSLPDAINAGGYAPGTWLPKLAIARADAPEVHMYWGAYAFNIRFESRGYRTWSARKMADLTVAVGAHRRDRTVANKDGTTGTDRVNIRATAPVPKPNADVIERTKFDPAKCHILFEANWSEETRHGDPYLVQYVAGDLWAILDAWDLTEVERIAMATRRI